MMNDRLTSKDMIIAFPMEVVECKEVPLGDSFGNGYSERV